MFEDDETGKMIPIWQWSGYSTKQRAINKIYKLKEGTDFLLNQNVKRTEGRGGSNNHQYLFTKDGFKIKDDVNSEILSSPALIRISFSRSLRS